MSKPLNWRRLLNDLFMAGSEPRVQRVICMEGIHTVRETWKAETMPNAVPNESKHPLLHFHVCVHCGSVLRREVFEGRALTSGIYLCPKCGLEGPLNVEIRKPPEPGPSEGK